MDIYVLNQNLDRIDIIEGIVSFIWSERYSDYGDFVLQVPISKFPYNSLVPGNYLENPESKYLAMIETVLRDRDHGNDDLITVRGRFLEGVILEERAIMDREANWTFTNQSVGWIATEAVRRVCVQGIPETTNDRILNLDILEQDASTIQRSLKLEAGPLWNNVKALIDEDELGVRIYFIRETKRFEFRIYRGKDRTKESMSSDVSYPVIFSSDLDNFYKAAYLKSILGYKNVAYVQSGGTLTYRVGSGTGINRRVLYVNASDIKDPTAEKLAQRGREALKQHNRIDIFDGEAENTRSFRYGRDYFMGDIVNLKGDEGPMARARVTEFVTTYDSDGFRSYPTFTTLSS